MHHPTADIDRLYIKKENHERLLQTEMTNKTNSANSYNFFYR